MLNDLVLFSQSDESFLHANDQQLAPWLRSCLHIRMGEKRALMNAIKRHSV